jgi:predicted glycosyltransferase
MAADQVDLLRTQAAGLDVRIERFRPDMDAVLAGARAVVSMAGYSTVAEVLGSGKPALLVPRTSPREEQLNRARRLAAAGRVEMLDPAALGPAQFRRAIERLLDRPPTVREPPTGAADAANILVSAALGSRAAL